MHIADQPAVEVLGDTLALMIQRERGVWLLHDTDTGILAIVKGRFKEPQDHRRPPAVIPNRVTASHAASALQRAAQSAVDPGHVEAAC